MCALPRPIGVRYKRARFLHANLYTFSGHICTITAGRVTYILRRAECRRLASINQILQQESRARPIHSALTSRLLAHTHTPHHTTHTHTATTTTPLPANNLSNVSVCLSVGSASRFIIGNKARYK